MYPFRTVFTLDRVILYSLAAYTTLIVHVITSSAVEVGCSPGIIARSFVVFSSSILGSSNPVLEYLPILITLLKYHQPRSNQY